MAPNHDTVEQRAAEVLSVGNIEGYGEHAVMLLSALAAGAVMLLRIMTRLRLRGLIHNSLFIVAC